MNKRLLIVDDDHSMRTILQEALTNSGYDVKDAKNGKTALNVLLENEIDLIISDLMMPEMDGVELMQIVNKNYPNIGYLIITAYGSIETAVEALHGGAFDFITKPFSISQIESRIERYFEYKSLKEENTTLKQKLSDDKKYDTIVGKSNLMQNVLYQIGIVAKSDAPVFIQGESGTGKELIAKSIHENSNRKDKPYYKVNCSAIPESLFESTLFGHEKGSFTNAINQHLGLFEEAHNGTLLLDEITEMPISLQSKLLRTLQEQKITRIGSTKEIDTDVRVIATTNRNINTLIENEKFRSDLLFRLNVFPINVAPLRARPEDIPLYVDHFLKKFRNKYNYGEKSVSKEAIIALNQQSWPGNVRQLENMIERAIIYSGDGPVLEFDHFSFEVEPLNIGAPQLGNTLMSISEMEKLLIVETLDKTENNRTKAAEILGITVRTLRNKLHQYEDDLG